MDVRIRVTEKAIRNSISKAINAIVDREISRFVEKLYRADFKKLQPHVEKSVREAVLKALESPEMIEFLKKEASEVARVKTASYIRNHPGAL